MSCTHPPGRSIAALVVGLRLEVQTVGTHTCGPLPSVEETCSESGGDCREMKGSDAWTRTMETTALSQLVPGREKRPRARPDARHERVAG